MLTIWLNQKLKVRPTALLEDSITATFSSKGEPMKSRDWFDPQHRRAYLDEAKVTADYDSLYMLTSTQLFSHQGTFPPNEVSVPKLA